MSAPFKFKLKVKTESNAAHVGSQPSASAGLPPDQLAQPAQPAAPKPFKLKVKMPPSSAAPPTAAPVQPQQPLPERWDAQTHLTPPAPLVGVKREAPAMGGVPAGAPRAIKKFKLTGSGASKPAGVPLVKKPIIKFKAPPPKQPRDAPAPSAAPAATLPIVRLTLPTVGSAPLGPRRIKSKGPPGAKPGAGGGMKKLKRGPGRPRNSERPKRSRSEMKELRDLGLDDDDLELDEDFDIDEPVAPRTFHLRSSQPAAAPSSTGLGASAGGPAPSDARTGAGGGAALADTAGTELPPVPRRTVPRGGNAFPPVPAGPPKKEDFERLLARCQKKDVQNVFKEPVTEKVAPGYFSVIKQPMDFSTMRAKASRGEYTTWEALQADMRLMFSNALTFNAEGSPVHDYAKLLAKQCDRIVELAMQGKTDFRSSAMITRKHNAAVRAAQKAERDALRAQARAEQKAAQESKVMKKAGLASMHDDGDDENIRNSYRKPVRDANLARWRGLGAGTNAEGVAWGPGCQVLRPLNPWLPPGMYALSLARFAANLKGRARELVLRRATASTAADEDAEKALQVELAKKVPVPPPAPTPPAMQPAAAAAAGAAGTSTGAAAAMPAGRLQGQASAMQAALGAATAAAGSVASAAAAPAAMLAQQQLFMQQAGRPPGLMMPQAMAQGMPRPPPGTTITLMPTPQGLMPFLMQPGQPPMLMGGWAQPGQKPGQGMQPMLMQPGFQAGFMPGMQQSMRPKQ